MSLQSSVSNLLKNPKPQIDCLSTSRFFCARKMTLLHDPLNAAAAETHKSKRIKPSAKFVFGVAHVPPISIYAGSADAPITTKMADTSHPPAKRQLSLQSQSSLTMLPSANGLSRREAHLKYEVQLVGCTIPPMSSISIEKIQITSQACEALCYGFFVCIFLVALYAQIGVPQRTTQLKVLFAIACGMFLITTGHFAITFYRALRAVSDLGVPEAGPAAFLGDSTSWYLITADVLYVTQCILADSVAIYRCWILYDRDIRVVTLPLILLTANIISGYVACQKLATSAPARHIDTAVRDWITGFYTLGVAHNTVTTTLMAVRLWWVDRRIRVSEHEDRPSIRARRPRLQTTILLLVESAALYFVLQVVVLITFVTGSDIQFLLLGSVPPVIAITFTLITIRVGLRARHRDSLDGTGRALPAGTVSSLTMPHQSPGTEDASTNNSVSENGEKFNLNALKNNDELV
ncbi:hypothetical protein MVEN_00343500 [Mycena venus]|uniref:Uncharacterized protein n=1 Tax=Mycena venus TaxID=2733690 RepID=A0A8H7D9Q3_9AGAR|nr:hypothetical protein MVEN_00343500 [Mycena venus]